MDPNCLVVYLQASTINHECGLVTNDGGEGRMSVLAYSYAKLLQILVKFEYEGN